MIIARYETESGDVFDAEWEGREHGNYDGHIVFVDLNGRPYSQHNFHDLHGEVSWDSAAPGHVGVQRVLEAFERAYANAAPARTSRTTSRGRVDGYARDRYMSDDTDTCPECGAKTADLEAHTAKFHETEE